MIRAVQEKAEKGDMHAAAILLARTWPRRRGRPVRLDLPPVTLAAGVVQAQAAVIAAMAGGEISPEEAASVAGVLEQQRRAIETDDHERRLQELEEEAKKRRSQSRPVARRFRVTVGSHGRRLRTVARKLAPPARDVWMEAVYEIDRRGARGAGDGRFRAGVGGHCRQRPPPSSLQSACFTRARRSRPPPLPRAKPVSRWINGERPGPQDVLTWEEAMQVPWIDPQRTLNGKECDRGCD